jgi:hypothetical protein
MSRRQKARRARTQAFWAAKEAAAHSAAATAQVEYDHTRAVIAHLPEGARVDEFRRVAAFMRQLRREIRDRNSAVQQT